MTKTSTIMMVSQFFVKDFGYMSLKSETSHSGPFSTRILQTSTSPTSRLRTKKNSGIFTPVAVVSVSPVIKQ